VSNLGTVVPLRRKRAVRDFLFRVHKP